MLLIEHRHRDLASHRSQTAEPEGRVCCASSASWGIPNLSITTVTAVSQDSVQVSCTFPGCGVGNSGVPVTSACEIHQLRRRHGTPRGGPCSTNHAIHYDDERCERPSEPEQSPSDQESTCNVSAAITGVRERSWRTRVRASDGGIRRRHQASDPRTGTMWRLWRLRGDTI